MADASRMTQWVGIVNATPDSFSDGGAYDPLAQAEALLEKYDIQLTLVGAEFTSDWAGTDAGTVEMILVVDANGFRHEVSIDWDFTKSVDANLDGILEELI